MKRFLQGALEAQIREDEKGGVNLMLDNFFKNGVEYRWVYRKYITKKGKRVYPKKAKCFRFAVPVK